MASLTLRQTKGAALTHEELDSNFTNLNSELGTKVVSVNGETGTVTLNTDDISEGTNQYFTTARARSAFSSGTGISVTDGVIATTITQYTDSNARGAISVNDTGGDGSLSYNSSTGSITYAGPTTSDYRAAFSAGSNISITDGVIAFTGLGYTAENTANKGVANGYASLDASGLVPSTQLPSYVDDVLEYANLAGFPATGVTGKIYVAIDSGKTYRWSGSAYVEISASPGSTDSVTEGSTNLYFTQARARASLTGSTGISYDSNTGSISSTITQYTDALARSSISGSTGISYNSSTGAISLASGVATAGTYAGKVTIDTYGRVTSATNDITGRTEPIFDLGTTGGTIAPNAANGAVQKITLNSALTINGFTSPVAGQSITLIIYGGTAYTSITSTMKFLGGVKTLTGTAGCIDVLTVYYDGTTYFAALGKGYA